MRNFIIATAVLCLLASTSVQAAENTTTDEAQKVYGKYGDAVYQVQVIDKTSNKKNAIGSGFQFTEDGLMATNYHVVSGVVNKPENNRLEYTQEKGNKGTLQILTADVVHDLAILKMDKPGATRVDLGTSALPKGTRLFSMGNPHDIGFTIVEGTHNGRSSESFINKIHFSGAINPGMSGGPVLGHDGRVVGVNVMTGGNQIGFLVPVEELEALVDDYHKRGDKDDFMAHSDELIQDQLLKSQGANIDALMNSHWKTVPFGPVNALDHVHNAFKCWGDTMHREKDPYKYYWQGCSSQDVIYINDSMDTGYYTFRYDHITGAETLPIQRFYRLYEERFAGLYDNGYATEEDATNFECHNSFVDLDQQRWKASYCIRSYKRFPKIFDAGLFMALTGNGRDGMLASMTAQGVSKENALRLAGHFLESLTAAKAGDAPKDAAPPAATPPETVLQDAEDQ